jgi:hypothetical protein
VAPLKVFEGRAVQGVVSGLAISLPQRAHYLSCEMILDAVTVWPINRSNFHVADVVNRRQDEISKNGYRSRPFMKAL